MAGGQAGGTSYVAWRAKCPCCGRDIAVSWDHSSGSPYMRYHRNSGEVCPGTGEYVDRRSTYLPTRD